MKVSEALDYLVQTDEPCGRARGRCLASEKTEKTIVGAQFLAATGTVAEREHKARTSKQYMDWKQDYENAWSEYEIMRLKRETAVMTIEVWRTQSSNKRAGNI